MAARSDINTSAILDSLLQTVQKELRQSLREETEDCVKTAISEFNVAVQKCKEQIFDERKKLGISLKQMLDDEVTKSKQEYEKELSKMDNMRLGLKSEMTKMEIEFTKFNEKLSEKMNEARKKYEFFITDIENQVFNNPNTLLKRVEKQSKLLNDDMTLFARKQREWTENDRRLARYLNITDMETMQPFENPTETSKDNNNDNNTNINDNSDEKETSETPAIGTTDVVTTTASTSATAAASTTTNVNDDSNKLMIISQNKQDNEFITIKIDSETFQTQRLTLTQVKGSILEKYFHASAGCLSPNKNGIYMLDSNPIAFKQILHLLRLRRNGQLPLIEKKDNSSDDDNDDNKVKMRNAIMVDGCVYQELEFFGLLDTFLPYICEYDNNGNKKKKTRKHRKNDSSDESSSNESDTILSLSSGAAKDDEKYMNDNKEDSNISHFIVYRSKTQNEKSKCINWDANSDNNKSYVLSSGKSIETMINIDKNDWSKINILKTGWYRITSRFVGKIGESNIYASIQLNGKNIKYCYKSGNNTAFDKTFYFNDILKLNSGDYIHIFLNGNQYVSNIPLSTCLCIEKISNIIETKMGIWQSSIMSDTYKSWNNTALNCDKLYHLNEDNDQISFKNGGLYRICGRFHTNFNDAGERYIRQYFTPRMSDDDFVYNWQGCSSSGYECHIMDTIVTVATMKDIIYFDCDDYGTVNNVDYDEISIIPIINEKQTALWRSSSNSSNYRVWDYGGPCNDSVYRMDDSDSTIIVMQTGYYRICAMITTEQIGDATVTLKINGNDYCISKMGCYNNSYRHTHFINEIIYCNENDKIRLYATHDNDDKDQNTLLLEKVPIEEKN